MILERRAVEPFFKNGFEIGCEDTHEGVVIDPGDEVDELLEAVEQQKLTITNVLLTHAHLDHVTGVAQAKRALGVPVWLHKDDNSLYEHVVEQGLMFGIRVDPQPPIDRFYQGQEPLRFGNYQVRVLHTPGHCPGGVCLAIAKDTTAGKEAKDTKEIAPLTAFRDLDGLGLLKNVPTLNFHPHLPHYELTTANSKSIQLLARQPIDLDRPHPFTEAGNREFNCLLWIPPNEQRAGDIVLVDSTNFTTLFGGTESLENFWRNLAAMR